MENKAQTGSCNLTELTNTEANQPGLKETLENNLTLGEL